MKTRSYLLHALSPLHAGTGQAADVIDLPIARMASTGIPIVPGSSVKGVVRDAAAVRGGPGGADNVAAVFGPPTDSASEHAGALMVGDARLLALPVRSYKGTFAWATSPLLLSLAARDLKQSGWTTLPAVPRPNPLSACLPEKSVLKHGERVYLQDLDLPATADGLVDQWAAVLAAAVGADLDFASRFLVVDDETMTFLFETATQIDTRVRLAPQTRTVAKGALWVEESLPPETLLIGIMTADRSRRANIDMDPDAVLDAALPDQAFLQFGGKATVGRGWSRLLWIPSTTRAEVPDTPAAVARV